MAFKSILRQVVGHRRALTIVNSNRKRPTAQVNNTNTSIVPQGTNFKELGIDVGLVLVILHWGPPGSSEGFQLSLRLASREGLSLSEELQKRKTVVSIPAHDCEFAVSF